MAIREALVDLLVDLYEIQGASAYTDSLIARAEDCCSGPELLLAMSRALLLDQATAIVLIEQLRVLRGDVGDAR